jgi:hypothetical protein
MFTYYATTVVVHIRRHDLALYYAVLGLYNDAESFLIATAALLLVANVAVSFGKRFFAFTGHHFNRILCSAL